MATPINANDLDLTDRVVNINRVAKVVKGGRRFSFAALAREHQIREAVFNRNGFLYHGRVKALADAAREAGLQI